MSLGKAIHYLEDICSPPHTVTKSGLEHSGYEFTATGYVMSSRVFNTTNSTYAYMTNTGTLDICYNFANYSAARWDEGSATKMKECLSKAQRGVAGFLYAFLVNTNRAPRP